MMGQDIFQTILMSRNTEVTGSQHIFERQLHDFDSDGLQAGWENLRNVKRPWEDD